MALLAAAEREALLSGARQLGLALTEEQADALDQHAALLLRWNQSINLTATTALREVVDKHLLDSLALAPMLPAGRLLDAGSGGGFPGLPLAIVRPDLDVTMVDSVQKKVAFLKASLATLGLKNARAAALRLAGRPAKEGLAPFDAAVARAFTAPAAWLALAEPYVKDGGLVLVLLGAQDESPQRAGRLALAEERSFRLPLSGGLRKVRLYRKG